MIAAPESMVIGFPGVVARRVAARLSGRGRAVRLLAPPGLEAEASAFAAALPGEALAVFGDLAHIDLGLPGPAYLELAAGLESIVLAATPGPPRPDEAAASGAEEIREVLELALSAPGLAHVVVLSHVDVAGDFDGSFAENDLDLGQRFPGPAGGERLVVERICRRFWPRIPLTVIRGGWAVGPDPDLAPVVAMLLAAGEEIERHAGCRLALSGVDGLSALLGDVVDHPPAAGGRVLHAVDPAFPAVEDLLRRTTAGIRDLAPGSFDLAAGAGRMLRRAADGVRWHPREFLQRQPRARIETAWTRSFCDSRGLPSVALGARETDELIEHAIEGIVGLR